MKTWNKEYLDFWNINKLDLTYVYLVFDLSNIQLNPLSSYITFVLFCYKILSFEIFTLRLLSVKRP